MTEKEKKAIDIIKYNDIARPLACGGITICNIEDLKTALNLIQRQQEDIQRMQECLDKSDANNAELRKEIKKKDKIIDAMVKVMIDSSICDYFIKQNCRHYAGENKKTCDDCIKQYFENKVESEDKQC